MLLTSAQVSVAITSTIVSIFTVTLFLSGYILQQRTVNNIREAIKPKVRPVHTFIVDVPTTATPVPVPISGDGYQIVEISPTKSDSNVRIAVELNKVDTNPLDRTDYHDMQPSPSDNAAQGHVASDGQKLITEEYVVSSRTKRPSQVENDNKDKEWALKLKKSRKEKAAKEDIPLDQLSTASRRKLYKQQLAIQDGQQPADPNAYRPRKRLW